MDIDLIVFNPYLCINNGCERQSITFSFPPSKTCSVKIIVDFQTAGAESNSRAAFIVDIFEMDLTTLIAHEQNHRNLKKNLKKKLYSAENTYFWIGDYPIKWWV